MCFHARNQEAAASFQKQSDYLNDWLVSILHIWLALFCSLSGFNLDIQKCCVTETDRFCTINNTAETHTLEQQSDFISSQEEIHVLMV